LKKRFGKYWANHFSTIGIVGMNDALQYLGMEGIHSDQGKDFALQVLQFMKEQLSEYQQQTGNLYNLEATPAEAAGYKLAQKDRDLFNPGEKARIYANSTNLPVDFTDDLAFALDHQEALQKEYTGGTVFHIFLGEKISAEQAKTLIRKTITGYSLPYVTLTPTFSICPIDFQIKLLGALSVGDVRTGTIPSLLPSQKHYLKVYSNG
ncbi:MAG: anaerobic ribonucleoside-triphosphate reductase, partial [Pseudomonadota bacterium]